MGKESGDFEELLQQSVVSASEAFTLEKLLTDWQDLGYSGIPTKRRIAGICNPRAKAFIKKLPTHTPMR